MNIELNVELFRMINDLGKEYLFLNEPFVFIAEYMVYFLLVAVIGYWFTRTYHNRMMIISASISFIVAEIIGKLAGKFYANNQPFAELAHVNQLIEKSVNNSFPSDHTILFFAFCFSFFFFKSRFRYAWVVLACLIGLSRIWVGVHYPLDVMVGAVIGITVAFLCYKVIPKSHYVNELLKLYEKYEQKLFYRTEYEQ